MTKPHPAALALDHLCDIGELDPFDYEWSPYFTDGKPHAHFRSEETAWRVYYLLREWSWEDHAPRYLPSGLKFEILCSVLFFYPRGN